MTLQFIISLACFVAGVGGRRLQVAGERVVAGLSWVITWILLPLVIIAAMSRLHLSPDTLLLPAANVFIVAAMLGGMAIVARFLRLPRRLAGSAVISFGSLEGGSIGLALVLALFGTARLPEFFVFDIVHALLLFTVTYLVAALYGKSGNSSGKLIRGFLLGPIPIAVVMGLVLNVAGVHLPQDVDVAMNAAGYLILPAVLAILGVRFSFRKEFLGAALGLTFVKIVVGYALALVFVSLFEPSPAARAIILLSSCLPPSFLTLVFAEEQKLDTEFLGTFLPISALISFVVLYGAFAMWPRLL